jgi:hypothetical protein
MKNDDPEPRWWEWAAIFAGALIAGALALARRCWRGWGGRPACLLDVSAMRP